MIVQYYLCVKCIGHLCMFQNVFSHRPPLLNPLRVSVPSQKEDAENKNRVTVHLLCYFLINSSCFQSLLDCASSLVFLISTVTIADVYQIHNTGILGWIECHLWNSEFVYFGLFVSSTWNIVVLTIEVCFFWISFDLEIQDRSHPNVALALMWSKLLRTPRFKAKRPP